MLEFFATFVILLVFWVYQKTQKPAHFPPGPPRLPLLGSVPFLAGPNFLQNTIVLKEKYGPCVGFYFGNTPAVVISELELAKEVFKTSESSGRPPVTPFQESFPGWKELSQIFPDQAGRRPGPIISHGAYHTEIRRFILRNLRDLGFGKTSMEAEINYEVANLCKFYESKIEEPFDPFTTTDVYIVNGLCSILCGEKLSAEDQRSKEIAHNIGEFMRY